MKLSRLLLGLFFVVDIAHGAAGRAWEGMMYPRAVVPTLPHACRDRCPRHPDHGIESTTRLQDVPNLPLTLLLISPDNMAV
jgi:hypothetical protein